MNWLLTFLAVATGIVWSMVLYFQGDVDRATYWMLFVICAAVCADRR